VANGVVYVGSVRSNVYAKVYAFGLKWRTVGDAAASKAPAWTCFTPTSNPRRSSRSQHGRALRS